MATELNLSSEVRAHFRDDLRRARLAALRDAEDFHDIIYCVERLGVALTGTLGALGAYQERLAELAAISALATEIPARLREFHQPFRDLYEIVKDGRNDALHQGACARHLANHALQLALVLEDALMPSEPKVSDFMVRDAICAAHWQPISFVRQQMLANSFSYLPILWPADNNPRWHVVSDVGVTRFLRSAISKADRNRRLAITIGEAIRSGELIISPARVSTADSNLNEIVATLEDVPIIIVAAENNTELRGIVTAFDLLKNELLFLLVGENDHISGTWALFTARSKRRFFF